MIFKIRNIDMHHRLSLSLPFPTTKINFSQELYPILNKNKGPELFPLTFFFEVREDLL